MNYVLLRSGNTLLTRRLRWKTATKFGVSKSTVHKDLTERLPQIDHHLADEVRDILDINKSERHIRGGMATRQKYLLLHRVN